MKHGHAGRNQRDPLYNRWRGMLDRCYNRNFIGYPRYGGRGISVCQAWWDFRNFRDDMEHGFSPELMLERKNNDGNYCKENCRWATRTEQNRNSIHNTLATAFGETLPLSVWAERFGINKNTLLGRLRMNWTIENALLKPVDHRRGAYQVKP